LFFEEKKDTTNLNNEGPRKIPQLVTPKLLLVVVMTMLMELFTFS
jgi:hypothetical protein